jgi:ACS family hexuronate transporter-like MFS transporter
LVKNDRLRLSYRWYIAVLIAFAITISYFDRQTLPAAIAAIQHDIPISNTRFSELQAAFLIAYAAMYAAGGKIMDVLGTRKGFLAILIFSIVSFGEQSWSTLVMVLPADLFPDRVVVRSTRWQDFASMAG